MCGIIALLLAQQNALAAPEANEALSLLQHRGQDAAGIVTCGPGGRFYQCKANGMVRDVFTPASLSRLLGNMALGHTRYPTAGSSNHAEAQPFYVGSPYGIVFAHNGNLTNTDELRHFLDEDAHRHINTDSDSEVLLNILANNLQKTGKFRINEEDIFTAIRDLMKQCSGGYACVAMIAGFGIIAFRDPNGIRPLGMCSRKAEVDNHSARTGLGRDYCFTSESVVCDALGFEEFEDVQPGEAVIITKTAVSRRILAPGQTFAPDIFEHIYVAREDSVIDGISVYQARMAMGDKLAENIRKVLADRGEKVDVIMPVPDSARVAALQVAQRLNLPYREGFVKNRYIARTFIMPGQALRRKNVRRKLNAMAIEFAGKSVMLVDDSIVRGTTSREIVQMARDKGATKVIMASCAPPIRHPNVYGINMPTRRELVAHGRTDDEIAREIQADLVIYQTLPDLIDSVHSLNPAIKQFECSVFDGKYVTNVTEDYLAHLESLRSENAKSKAAATIVNVNMEAANDPLVTRRPSTGALNGGSVFGMEAANGNGHAHKNGNTYEGCSGPLNGADAAAANADGGDDISLYNSYTR
jgi:amidophosphoribosyltransferase